jgi:hypothetical protein
MTPKTTKNSVGQTNRAQMERRGSTALAATLGVAKNSQELRLGPDSTDREFLLSPRSPFV